MPSLPRRAMLGTLATGIGATLAGCWGSHGPRLRLRPIAAAELPTHATRAIAPETTNHRLQPLVRTIEQGSAEVDARGSLPPIRRGEPVVAEHVGNPVAFRRDYYVVAMTDSVPKSFLEVELRIEPAPGSSVAGSGTIAYGALPAPDRAAIDRTLPISDGASGATVLALYEEAEVEHSGLVPEPQYDAVRRGADRYSVSANTEPERVSGHTYRYEARRVATTDAEYVDWLRSAYRWETTGLPDGEREILQEATEDNGYSDDEDDETFRSLSSRFLSRPALERSEETGEWFVQFDGEEYLADLQPPQAYA